jgi:hypothetical protein
MSYILVHVESEGWLPISVLRNRGNALQKRRVEIKGFKTPPPALMYELFFAVLYFCSFFPSSLLFASTLPFFLLHDDKPTNQRTNGNSVLLTSCSSFAYHYKLFTFYIASLSFDTRSATTMTTTIKTTTMLMTTPPLLHVAQKSSFKIF